MWPDWKPSWLGFISRFTKKRPECSGGEFKPGTVSLRRKDEVSLSIETWRFEVSCLHCVGTLYFVHFLGIFISRLEISGTIKLKRYFIYNIEQCVIYWFITANIYILISALAWNNLVTVSYKQNEFCKTFNLFPDKSAIVFACYYISLRSDWFNPFWRINVLKIA